MFERLDLGRLQAIGLSQALLGRLAGRLSEDDRAVPMRVTEVQREGLTLHDGDRERAARALPGLLRGLADEGDALAVGDWVLAEPDDWGHWWAVDRVPPLTQLARRHHDGREKVTRAVLVSNVDTALLVMGLDQDYNPRRLERYLALVRMAGVDAIVVLTKADLCTGLEPRLQAVRDLVPAEQAVVALDARSGDVRHRLAPWLHAGSTLVLLGSSGAGKSTLTNALIGREVQQTGAVRSGDDRGRHTTTARTLYTTPEGACVVDTPGLRTLRLDGDPGELNDAFSDIARLASACRFRDCRHTDEPGCAVRGVVDGARLRSYQKLRREAERDQLGALQRKARLSVWKTRAREAREVARAKRG